MGGRVIPVMAFALVLAAGASARGAGMTIAAGEEQTLDADVVLGAGDSFVAGDDSGTRCKIHGGGHKIQTTPGVTWGGSFTMKNCDVDGLGVGGDAAIETTGGMNVTIEGSIFHASSEIAIALGPGTNVAIRGNRIEKDSVVAIIDTSLDRSQDAFTFTGSSMGTKVVQGNVVLKGRLKFDRTSDWQIGGLGPGEGNILVGQRVGIYIERAGAMTIQGNYSSPGERGWNQVKNLNVFAPGGGPIIAEHNVLIGMAWNTEVNATGDLRYNLFANPIERAWVQVWSSGGPKIHHNVLVQTSKSQGDMIAGGFVVFPGDNNSDMPGPATVEIYNNTFDAGGTCNGGIAGAVNTDGVLASLRSNAFVNIRLPMWTGIGLVGTHDKTLMNPLPPQLGYADYNLFHNPDASVKANYSAGVDGLAVREPGFGYNDVPVGGAPNAQVDPKFAGPIPHDFPFTDADVVAGKVTVCQILAFYRAAYAPGAGSPLVDAGDPMEGDGNDIGAVGAGTPNDLDKFGTLCAPGTFDPLVVANQGIYSCPSVPIGGVGPGGGGGGGELPPSGITCVCDASAGGGTWGVGAAVLVALVVTRTRTRTRTRTGS